MSGMPRRSSPEAEACTPVCFVNRRMGSRPLPLCSVAHAELNNSFLVLIKKGDPDVHLFHHG